MGSENSSKHAARRSSSTTTTTTKEEAAECDTSAPPTPGTQGSIEFVVKRGEESSNESCDETNDINPEEKSFQTDMKCKDISLL